MNLTPKRPTSQTSIPQRTRAALVQGSLTAVVLAAGAVSLWGSAPASAQSAQPSDWDTNAASHRGENGRQYSYLCHDDRLPFVTLRS